MRIDARWSSQPPSLAARCKPSVMMSVMSRYDVQKGVNGLSFPMATRYSWNRSSMRVQDASPMSAVNEVCDTSLWKMKMLLSASSTDDEPLLRGWHGSKAEIPSKLASSSPHTRSCEA